MNFRSYLIFIITFCLFSSNLLAEQKVILLDGKDVYDVGYEISIFEDSSNKLTINDVTKKKFRSKYISSKTKIPNIGISRSSFWIRLKIENKNHPSNVWLLAFEQVWCDYVELYKKISGNWKAVTKTGDRRAFSTRDVKNRNFVFNIRPEKGTTYYLKIKSDDGIQIPLKLYSPIAFSEKENFKMAGFGFFYGIMFVMIFYNLFVYLSTKSVSYLYYILYISSYTLLNMASNGLGFQFLYPDWIWFQNEGFLLRASLTALFLIFFTINYLGVNKSTPVIHKFFIILTYLAIGFLVGSFFPFYKYLLTPFYFFLVLGFTFFILVGAYKLKLEYRPAKYYLLAFIFITGGGILQIGQMNGFLPPWFIFLNAFQIGGVFEVILLSLGLADIINSLLEENLKANKLLEDANINLEDEVKERTKELSMALDDISNLLDNMRQAVFTISNEGIVQKPVSKYSEIIFGNDIVGDDLFNNVFIGIDKDSEVYSTIKFSLSILFGSDDLQWEMVKDHFPNRVIYNSETLEHQKILKIAYNPLFDKSNLIQSIMFVVEDITEIEKLEKEVEEQRKNSMKNIQILQELALNKKEDLSEFFSTTNKMTMDSIFIAKKIRSQVESSEKVSDLPILFRQLHTIKGNARVYGLSYISSSAHQIETILSKFITDNYNENLGYKKNHDYEGTNSLVQELYALQGQVSQYINSAKEVFSLEFKEDLKFKSQLHELLKSLEYLVSKLSKRENSNIGNYDDFQIETIDSIKNNSDRTEIIEEIENISHSMKGLARGIDEKELSQKIHHLESGISYFKDNEDYSKEQYQEYFIDPIGEIRKICKNIFVKSSQFHNLELNTDFWSILIKDITIISEKLINKSYINSNDIIQNVYHIHSNTLSIKLDFFPALFRYLYDLIESKTLDNELKHQKIIFTLNEIWKFIIILFQLDLYKNISPGKRVFFIESFLNNEPIDPNVSRFEKTFIWQTLNILEKNGLDRNDLFGIISKTLKIDIKSVINLIFGDQEFKNFINEIYYELFRFDLLEAFDKIERLFSLGNYSFVNNLKEFMLKKDFSWHFYSKNIDLLKLFKNYIDIEDYNASDLKPKVHEILVENYDYVKKTIISIPSIKNEENILNEMFDKLLYLPVKFSLFRYQKVIKEISENLGKKIKFSLVGEECSLDRDSLNILQEAIVHLIRNAVDHGIEKPNDRLIKGKNEVGLIEILCQQLDGDNISITIKDDGVGIDINKLTEKGVKLGLVEKDKIEVMSTKEKINLIFLPSVSTKENVTEISGRGIGMDVVQKSLNLLGADLNIETTMNEGTSFCLTFSSNAKVKPL